MHSINLYLNRNFNLINKYCGNIKYHTTKRLGRSVLFLSKQQMVPDQNFQMIYCPECSATGMGQFPICKLKWDLLRTSVTACTIDENTFSAPFGIFYVRTEI